MKTRVDIANRVLKILRKLIAGEAAAVEDMQDVDDLIDPLVANLATRGVVYIGNVNEIEDEVFEPFCRRLAWDARVSFGVGSDKIPECQPSVTEGELRALGAGTMTNEPIRAQYY